MKLWIVMELMKNYGQNIYNSGTIRKHIMLSIYYGKDMEHMETSWKNMVEIWKHVMLPYFQVLELD